MASESGGYGGYGHGHSSYGCCDSGVDPATLLALITSKDSVFQACVNSQLLGIFQNKRNSMFC